MILFVSLILVVNMVAVFGLLKDKQSRGKLLNSLIEVLRDQQVDN